MVEVWATISAILGVAYGISSWMYWRLLKHVRTLRRRIAELEK